MLHASEVPVFITGSLPQLKAEFTLKQQVYDSMQVLTDYTRHMAVTHNFKEVKKCVLLVEKIYKHGDALVRNSVENIFIFSFSSTRLMCNIVEWRIIQSFMSTDLYNLYIQQVVRSKN